MNTDFSPEPKTTTATSREDNIPRYLYITVGMDETLNLGQCKVTKKFFCITIVTKCATRAGLKVNTFNLLELRQRIGSVHHMDTQDHVRA